MTSRFLQGLLTILLSAAYFANAGSPHLKPVKEKLDCETSIDAEVRKLRNRPMRIQEFVSRLTVVNTPVAYCNGMGDDNEWPSFTSKELNDGAIDWVVRTQVIEKLLGVKLETAWLGSSQIDASEEPLLESRKNALTDRNLKCRAYYRWSTQGIYFIPPVETQAEIVKIAVTLAKRKRR